MASGILDGEEVREKRRWGENHKVYTRKFHNKGLKKNNTNNSSSVPQQSSQTLATEVANSSHLQQETVSRVDAILDNSLSHNLSPQVSVGRLPGGNGVIKPVITRTDNRVRIDLADRRSKSEIGELRRKLASELDQVRSLMEKLESEEVQLSGCSNGGVGDGYGHSRYSENGVVINRGGLVRVNSEVGSVDHLDSRPFRNLSVQVILNNHGLGDFVEKEKRTPKANQYYCNSEFLLGKERLPTESNKKLKPNGGRKHSRKMAYGLYMDKCRNRAFKSCSNLLAMLMKHKHGWVFNKPVDAKALCIHDYHDIIKHPMDLGTIKNRLPKNWYKCPREFAEDVRLTFRNAMTYNSKGQDAYIMAEQLSQVFEEKWAVIEAEFNLDWRYGMVKDMVLQTPTSRKAPHRSKSMTGMTRRTLVPKKPKANDPDKRDMTSDEKHKLSTNLQSLPPEKLEGIIRIFKKSSSELCQQDEEIEVDLDCIDAQTLWELDRYVTNYKKCLSKKKRKAELGVKARAQDTHATPAMNQATGIGETPKESKTDDNHIAISSPVQGEKQDVNASRSSSSSSSSGDSGSSSSDSGSDSSSDGGHSPRT